jgi:hypothetical protein
VVDALSVLRYLTAFGSDEVLIDPPLQYWDRDEKIRFMDKHEIDISVVRYVIVLSNRLCHSPYLVEQLGKSMVRFLVRVESSCPGQRTQ